MSCQSRSAPGYGSRAPILVIGFDSGTTSFKPGMLEAEEICDNSAQLSIVRDPQEQIIGLGPFPGNHRYDSCTTPTALVYDKEGYLFKYGNDAVNFQTSSKFDPSLNIEHWKLFFRKASNSAARQLRQKLKKQAKSLGIPPEKFIEDFFSVVGRFLLESERSPILINHGGKQGLERFKYIDFVIALPPGWSREEHKTFTNSAVQGLGREHRLRVFTVSETECVLRHWTTQGKNAARVKTGEVVILLDLGGGTACISAFRCVGIIDAKSRFEHMESYSLSAGSQIVTEDFVRDFKTRLKDAGFDITSQLLYRARKAFDDKKLSIGEERPEPRWSIEVTGLPRDDDRNFAEGRMWFTGAQLLNYFSASQDQILEKVEEIASRISREYTSPKYCLTAGAYANNVIFQERLRAANTFGMAIKPVPSSGEAVMRGACLTRVDGEFRQLLGSRYSVAALTFVQLSKAVKDYPSAAAQTFAGDRIVYSPALDWKIKLGDEIKGDGLIDVDLKTPRERYFHRGQEVKFTDTIFISESHPGEGQYTYLQFKTDSIEDWKRNMRDLRERGIEGEPLEVDWDLADAVEERADGSQVPIPRVALHTNKKGLERVDYKYYISVGQIDVTLYIEARFKNNRTHMMKMNHRRIIFLDEPESTALEQEYKNRAVDDDDDLEEDLDDVSRSSGSDSREDFQSPTEHSAQVETVVPAASIPLPFSCDYNTGQREDTAIPGSKRKKRTTEAGPSTMTQSAIPAPRLMHRGRSDSSSSADPSEPPAARPRYSNRGSTSNGRSYRSRGSQGAATPSENSQRRQESLPSLRTPVVAPRNNRLWGDIMGSQRSSRHASG